MSLYVYRCAKCGETDERFPIGTAPRTFTCECGKTMRLVLGRGMYIAADALPNKRHGVREIEQREARWSKDMPVYKDARHSGLQPRQIDGCAEELAHVEDQVDIDHRLTTPERKQHKSKIVDTMAALAHD